MSQTSKSPQEGRNESGDVSSYEDLKKQMMNQLDTSAESLAEVDASATTNGVEPVDPVAEEVVESDSPAEVAMVKTATDEEESVEDYMNRLLQRSSADKKAEAPVETKKTETPPAKELLAETFAEDLKDREKLLEPVKLTKATLPELEASFLNEMRNVSRQSADHAISDCQQRKYRSLASIQLGIGASLVGFGLLQTMVAPTMLNTTLVALPCYAVAVYFFYRYTQWRNLTKTKVEPTLEPEAAPKPA